MGLLKYISKEGFEPVAAKQADFQQKVSAGERR